MKTQFLNFICLLTVLFSPVTLISQTIDFDDSNIDTIKVSNTSYYEIGLLKSNGAILYVKDLVSNTKLFYGNSNQNLWLIKTNKDSTYISSSLSNMFTYNWDSVNKQLILTYTDPQRADVEIVISPSLDKFFDMRMTMVNNSGMYINTVSFPNDLMFKENTITSGLFPDKPGVMLSADYFQNLNSYGPLTTVHPPAMADYLGLQTSNSTFAVYTVWGNGPLYINFLGFDHFQGDTGVINHGFNVWRPDGYSWTSAPVRIRLANNYEETLDAYRIDNGINNFESLDTKLGNKYDSIVQSPVVGFDGDWFGNYTDWPLLFKDILSPSIILLSNFWSGGFHGYYPDVIPPNPVHGTAAEFKASLDSAHSYGLKIMPMVLPSWWHENSPTIQNLPIPLDSVVCIDPDGNLAYSFWELGGLFDYGYSVSPRAPFVINRTKAMLDSLQSYGSDLIYEDVLGSIGYGPDFNDYAPDTIDTEAWLDHTRTFKNRLLMTESGSDYFAETEVGFLGGGHTPKWTEFETWSTAWPMSSFLLKDKVLHYHYWADGTTKLITATTPPCLYCE